MAPAKKKAKGEIVTAKTHYSVAEICEICGIQAELIIDFVDYGVLDPRGDDVQSWQFTDDQLERSQKALRLQRDLELNYQGIALVLDLLDEVDRSHQQIQQLQHLLKVFNIS